MLYVIIGPPGKRNIHAASTCVFGIAFMFIRRKKDQFAKDYSVFYLLYFPIPFLFLIDGNMLFKHYVHFFAFAIPFVSYLSNYTYIHFKDKFSFTENKNFGYYFLVLLIIFVFFITLSVPFNKSELLFSRNVEGQFLEFKEDNIPENALIIYDDRIYNSLAGWIFNDRYYITASSAEQFLTANEQSQYKQSIPVFIVECVRDDCGWGTIKDNQPLNQSMEGFFDSLKEQGVPVVHVSKEKIYPPTYGINYYNPIVSDAETKDYFAVYKTTMNIDLSLAQQVKMQYNYFLYPSGYENKNQASFQSLSYTPEGLFEATINKLAWIVFYLEIILCFITVPWIIIETYIYI